MKFNFLSKKFLIVAVLSAFFIVNVGSANAQEQVEGLQITCEQGETQCIVEPSRTDPLFDEDNLYPGEEVTRQIEVTNNRDEVCYFSIDEFSDVEDSLADSDSELRFADVLFTEISVGEDSLISERSFTDLFESVDSDPLFLVDIDAEESKTFDWSVRFDESAGNGYQAVDLGFDFDWTFQCGEKPTITATTDESVLGVSEEKGEIDKDKAVDTQRAILGMALPETGANFYIALAGFFLFTIGMAFKIYFRKNINP
ncbi:MAG: hypothetical protein ACOC4Z_02950 [Patescibacteria group bacterium]